METNNPVGAQLNVHLRNQISGAGSFFNIKLSSATTGNKYAQGYNLSMAEDGTGYLWNNTAAKPIIFGTAGAEKMRIDSSGNACIGGHNPTSNFTIRSTYKSVDTDLCLDSSDDATNNKIYFKDLSLRCWRWYG